MSSDQLVEEVQLVSSYSAMAGSRAGTDEAGVEAAGVNEAMIPAGHYSDDGNILTPTTSVGSGGTVRACNAPLADSVEARGFTQVTREGTEDQTLLRQLVA